MQQWPLEVPWHLFLCDPHEKLMLYWKENVCLLRGGRRLCFMKDNGLLLISGELEILTHLIHT